MRPIDVHHQGLEHVICCWQVDDVLVDPGPESCLDTLLDALSGEQPRALLLTHIHFDHAGAAGALVREWPDLEVWVHERGARHLVDPDRLVASAKRLYGDAFDELWGEVVPIPERSLRVLRGGESLDGWDVAYTPGHASHHVSYRHADSGWVFPGDTCGVRLPGGDLLLAPTPPPDVDLDAWRASLDAIEAWDPATLAVTHFGDYGDVPEHLERMREALSRYAELARTSDQASYERALLAEYRAAFDEAGAASFGAAMPVDQQWLGLDRYWRKRAERLAEQAGSGTGETG